MKEFFMGLILGAVLTAGTGWYFMTARHTPAVQRAQDATAIKLRQTVDAVEAKLAAWHLTTPEIEEEVKRTGKVVRRRVREFGTTIGDTASDTRITGQIKAKYALDKELAPQHISVSTSDGVVTLTGTTANYAQIGRAILLARETEGERDVVSTLKVK